ncbi:MAG: DNA methyltransferase [Rhabdochlamydiaceae bacterium]|jgi:type I restriction-modification system DNA methylase subunit
MIIQSDLDCDGIVNISKIEENIREVVSNFSPDTFIYDLLRAFGKPKASIARLKKGSLNLSRKADEIIWKKNIYFKKANKNDLYLTLDQVSQNERILRHNPRFLIVSDYQSLLAFDTTTAEKLDIPIEELLENFDFFLPLSGIEKTPIHKENEADIKAAERMAKIYEEICKRNPNMEPKQKDAVALNVFLSRLLFCFFAESTGIFKNNQFLETINGLTQEDGGDLQEFFDDLFDSLNKKKSDKSDCPKWVRDFPYVNGGLFKDRFKIPKFTHRLRKMIVDSGRLDWSSINPDIFGSMIQSVIDPDQRSCLGMHYTSVTNIMKVIRPLFLDDLYLELEESKNNRKKLVELYNRLGRIKVLDPACGSGNFLIIAYKELRKFEIDLLDKLELKGKHPEFWSRIQLSQFYGIEIDEFACEIAKLSLWIAEHQMNIAFKMKFGDSAPSLPLKEGGHIECRNAARFNWNEICPADRNAEIYLLGNPPYQGARKQSSEQKKDIEISLHQIDGRNNLDYVSCWVYKASQYISESKANAAFVTTNSITQGMQVSILWPRIFQMRVEIGFAHTSFKWSNNAKNNAGVACVIIGLRNECDKRKFIYAKESKRQASNINGYLANYKNVVVAKRSIPISWMPKVVFGSMPNDNGHLLLSDEEKKKLIKEFPKAKKFIRQLIGGEEFLDRIEKYCLWIGDEGLKEALTIDPIRQRILKVKKSRATSPRIATQKLSEAPHRFGEIRHQENDYILIPSTTSENREYIPIGFLPPTTIAKNSTHVIYGADPLVFGLLTSKMHNVWTQAIAGRLEMRIIYSAEICYNNFPVPDLNKNQKESIKYHVRNVLAEREKHPERTIAELYDPKKMPVGLREAHRNLDAAVERCYRSKPFESDEERLKHLFKLYEEMIQNEKKRK